MKPFCQFCFNDPVTHLQQKELCGICDMETEVAKRKQTKADMIRSMTDKELTELFTGYYYDGPKFWCPAQPDIGEDECAKADDCRECFLNWLKRAAEEQEGCEL